MTSRHREKCLDVVRTTMYSPLMKTTTTEQNIALHAFVVRAMGQVRGGDIETAAQLARAEQWSKPFSGKVLANAEARGLAFYDYAVNAWRAA